MKAGGEGVHHPETILPRIGQTVRLGGAGLAGREAEVEARVYQVAETGGIGLEAQTRLPAAIRTAADVWIDYLAGERMVRLTGRLNLSPVLSGESRNTTGHLFAVVPPLHSEWLQRRQLFRINVSLPLTFQEVRLPRRIPWDRPAREKMFKDLRKGQGRVFHLARTRDISGKGLSLSHRTTLRVGSELLLLIRFPNWVLQTAGRVTSVRHRADNVTAGVEFVGLSPRDQDRIVHFVFSEERRRRRRKLELD